MFDSAVYHRQHYRSLRGQLSHRMSSARGRAKKKGLAFDLDIEFLEQLWEAQGGKCCVSGMTMLTDAVGSNKAPGPYALSIDRKDSTKGYTKDNVQLTTGIINRLKSVGTEETIEKLAFAYLQHSGYQLIKAGD